jgi:MFS family permease
MNEKQERMEDESIEEWSRHYDSIAWTVNTIFIAAIGGLLVYSYSQDSQEFPALVAPILGLFLIPFVMFYISGFRIFRVNLHSKIRNPDLKKFLKNPYQRKAFSQWKLYAIYMFMISTAFVYYLFLTLKGSPVVYVSIAILMGALILQLWSRGASKGSQGKSSDDSEEAKS